MKPNMTEQNRVIPPVFSEGDHEINLLDLDPEMSKLESKLLDEKR